jgi:hypothetical protein
MKWNVFAETLSLMIIAGWGEHLNTIKWSFQTVCIQHTVHLFSTNRYAKWGITQNIGLSRFIVRRRVTAIVRRTVTAENLVLVPLNV